MSTKFLSSTSKYFNFLLTPKHFDPMAREYQGEDFRFLVAKSIREGKLKLDKCDFDSLFTNMSIISKGSSSGSETVLGFAEIKQLKTEVVFKVSFYSRVGSDDNSLDVELFIYDKITNPMLFNKITPNIMTCIDAYQCDNFLKQLKDAYGNNIYGNDPVLVNLLKDLKKIKKNDKVLDNYDYKKVNILLLERGNGKSLYDFLVNDRYTSEELKSIVFQVLYTLWNFSLRGLQVNDGHLNNIWIEKNIHPRNLIYFINDTEYFVVPCHFLVKIYDFDFSNVVDEIDNTKIENNFCKSMGICNAKNPKFDTFLFLSDLKNTLFDNSRDAEFENFLSSNIDQRILNKKYGFHDRLCNEIRPGVCDGPFEPNNKLMSPTEKMLEDNYFKVFKYKLPEYDPDYISTEDGGNYEFVYYSYKCKRNKDLIKSSPNKKSDSYTSSPVDNKKIVNFLKHMLAVYAIKKKKKENPDILIYILIDFYKELIENYISLELDLKLKTFLQKIDEKSIEFYRDIDYKEPNSSNLKKLIEEWSNIRNFKLW